MTHRGDRVKRVLDELRFGPSRTLNVRDTMPSGDEAVRRVDQWLRGRQVEGTDEVLIITGRGAGSPGGIGVVRQAVARRLTSLRRLGVVGTVVEHSAGSFVVRLAPLRTLLEAARRNRDPVPEPPVDSATTLEGLDAATGALLTRLAIRALDALGIESEEGPLLRAEVERQFSLLVLGAPAGRMTDSWLRDAAERALREYDDAPPPP